MTDQPGWSAPGPGYGPPPPGYGQPSPGFAQPPTPGWGPPPPGPPPPLRPGIIPLRPLGVGEILDGSISTMRTHPKAMLGLSLLVAVVVQLVTLPVAWLLLRNTEISFSMAPEDQPTFDDQLALIGNTSVASMIQGVVTMIAVLFLTGILTAVVSRAVLGQPITIGDAWREARPRLPALFGVTLLLLLMEIGVFAASIGPPILAALLGAPAVVTVLLSVLGVPVFLVVSIYLYVIFALGPSAAVLERQGVVPALRRSRGLVKGAWWRTFGILILIFVIAYVISLVLALPFSVVGMIAAFMAGDGGELRMFAAIPLMITGIGSILTSAITWPFTATGTVLLYVDRRIRREALDIELARAAGMASTSQP